MSAQAESNPQLDWARFYYSLGWSVIPSHRALKADDGSLVCSCAQGAGCVSKGKHPALAWTQFQRERATLAQLEAWFGPGGPFRGYSIGLITGAVSGFFVVDVDTGQGKPGADTIRNLQLVHDDLPPTVTARTGGGGLHYLMRHPGGDVTIVTARNVLGPGVDIRGDGGFIVAAPSMHASGRFYLWDEHSHPKNTPLAEAPGWLVEMATQATTGGAAGSAAPTGSGEIIKDGWGWVVDGRERHMIGIICGVIASHLKDCGLLPSVDEVFAEAWPSYSTTTRARGASLEADHRGETLMRQRIGHMLRRAARGKWEIKPEAPAWGAGAEADPGADPGAELRQESAHGTREPGQKPENEGQNRPKKKKIRILTLREMENMDPPEWVVEGLLQTLSLAIFYGLPKSGKTFILLSLCLHIAAGVPWFGRKVKQGAVVYVVGEGAGGLQLRTRTMRQQYGFPDDIPFYVIPHALHFGDPKLPGELIAEIREIVGDQPIAMVVLDTVARMMLGADENSSQDMGRFVAASDTIKETLRTQVTGAHHAGKEIERGLRGSSALRGALDTCVRVERADNGPVTMTVVDQKDSESGQVALFDMLELPVPGRPGRTSLVPVEPTPPTPEAAAAAAKAEDRRRAGEPKLSNTEYARMLLERAMSKYGRPVPDTGAYPSGAIAVTSDQFRDEYYSGSPGKSQAAKQKGFVRALQILLQMRVIASYSDLIWFVRKADEPGAGGAA